MKFLGYNKLRGDYMEDFQTYLDRELSEVNFSDELTERNEIWSVSIFLSKQIIEARKELGISQSVLAKKIGIQQASLSKIETGEGNPSIQTLGRIATGLGKKLVVILE